MTPRVLLLLALALPPQAVRVPVEPGIEVQVLHRAPRGKPRPNPVLFVHGGTFPVASAFDVALPGGSWLQSLADAGFDVYAMDVRGYGGSTRPAAMDADPKLNAPLADTAEASRDVAAAVAHVLAATKAPRVDLVGWSWGTALAGGYAAEHPDRVERLVLFAPIWLPIQAPKYDGAYRLAHHDGVRAANVGGIPAERVEDVSPQAWFDTWWTATLATDPSAAARTPPSIRAPNGAFKDLAQLWAAGKPTYDPAAIQAATLLIVGEWDAVTPPAMAEALFGRLTRAKEKRLVLLSEATHYAALEKHRGRLMSEVRLFLESRD